MGVSPVNIKVGLIEMGGGWTGVVWLMVGISGGFL